MANVAWKDQALLIVTFIYTCCPAFIYLIMSYKAQHCYHHWQQLFGMGQVQTLATLKDWEGLEALAKEKKNVLPIPVYIAACKSNGAPTQATARYPSLVPWPCDAESPHEICCARSHASCTVLISIKQS